MTKKIILKMTKEEQEEFNKDNPEKQKKPKIIKAKNPVTKKQELKEIKKIEEDSKNLPATKDEGLKDIVLEISVNTKYDLNWSYIRQRLYIFIVAPYRQYENWFNKTFNSPKEISFPGRESLSNSPVKLSDLITDDNLSRRDKNPGGVLPMEKKDNNSPPINPAIMLKIKQIEKDLKELKAGKDIEASMIYRSDK